MWSNSILVGAEIEKHPQSLIFFFSEDKQLSNQASNQPDHDGSRKVKGLDQIFDGKWN